MSFKKGDVVQLKSGGPLMTVTGVIGEDPNLAAMLKLQGYEDGDATVDYFVDNILTKGTFKSTSIKVIEDM